METDVQPAPEIDVLVSVLVAFDDHLAALHRIRDRMVACRSTDFGGRRALALEGVASADRFGRRVRDAVDGV